MNLRSTIKFVILLSFIHLNLAFSQQYVLLGWNDLGMHCSNKDFSKMGILPPYNNVYAQLIKKQTGQSPQIVTAGFVIEYSIPGNTYSVGKTNFWTYAQALFGLPDPLPNNIGLTGKGLTGNMDISTNSFKAEGIPNTPFIDSDWNVERPFQLFHLVARENGVAVSFTDNVIPVSNEVGCVQSGCHSSEQNIKNEHPEVVGFRLNTTELCARCHSSNALGTVGDSLAKSFSYRIHEKHHDIQPINGISTCYKCHPGPVTQCFRDIMRNQGGMICQNCHGTMEALANSISNGRRPWLDEPKCGDVTCHGSVYAEEPGKLYRMSKGHGGLYCSSCHGSPHAIYPTSQANDNVQSIRLQNHAGAIDNCLVCHSSPPTGPGPHGIIFIGIIKIETQVPREFGLDQNYPNPFNPSTRIRFHVPKSSFVSLTIHDLTGREVSSLVNTKLEEGTYEAEWNGENFSSGVYFVKMVSGSYMMTKKMMLTK